MLKISNNMKTIIITATIIIEFIIQLFFTNTFAQVPNLMSYQAVVRDNQGELVINRLISVRIQIRQGSEFGPAAYAEIHKVQTNENGLFTLEIGKGLSVIGSFDEIKWEEGPYFLRTEIDLTGGTDYSVIITSQFLTVPYAFYAEKVGEIIESDPIYTNSVAAGITSEDTIRWNAKLDSFAEVDPIFNASVAKGITSADTARWNHKISSEKQNLTDVLGEGNNGGGMQIKNIASPTDAQDAATKAYVDAMKSQIERLTIKVNTIEAGGPITDVEGNVYNTVKIGNQVWMAENLRTTKLNDSSVIPVSTNNQWQKLTTPVYCWYNNDGVNYKIPFGAYYNYYTVATNKLCPVGWRVPNNSDWNELITFLEGDSRAGIRLKSTENIYWYNNGVGDNRSGFSAIAGGFYNYYSHISGFDFIYFGYRATWWSASFVDNYNANNYTVNYSDGTVVAYSVSWQYGVNVRCLKE